MNVKPQIAMIELDLDPTGNTGTVSYVLVPASQNLHGLVCMNAWAVVTEAITDANGTSAATVIEDESDNTLFTVAAADNAAIGVLEDSSVNEWETDVATGSVDRSGYTVAAGEYVDCRVSVQSDEDGAGVGGGKLLLCLEYFAVPGRVGEIQ
jgi:hypothetical protein